MCALRFGVLSACFSWNRREQGKEAGVVEEEAGARGGAAAVAGIRNSVSGLDLYFGTG